MANMRYFNLKALNNVRVRNLDINVNVRRVFDPMHTDLANYGSVTEANSNFPQHNHSAGMAQGRYLLTFMDLGSVADTNMVTDPYNEGKSYDYGLITE